MFNGKESLERKLRVVTATVTALTGTGALVCLLNREAFLAEAAQPPTPSVREANDTYVDHVFRGEYRDSRGDIVRIVREPIQLDVCTDTDGGDNIWVKGTVYPPGPESGCGLQGEWPPRTDICADDIPSGTFREVYGGQNVLIEFNCEDSCSRNGGKGYFCGDYGAFCQKGRCVRQVFLPLIQSNRP